MIHSKIQAAPNKQIQAESILPVLFSYGSLAEKMVGGSPTFSMIILMKSVNMLKLVKYVNERRTCKITAVQEPPNDFIT